MLGGLHGAAQHCTARGCRCRRADAGRAQEALSRLWPNSCHATAAPNRSWGRKAPTRIDFGIPPSGSPGEGEAPAAPRNRPAGCTRGDFCTARLRWAASRRAFSPRPSAPRRYLPAPRPGRSPSCLPTPDSAVSTPHPGRTKPPPPAGPVSPLTAAARWPARARRPGSRRVPEPPPPPPLPRQRRAPAT